MWTRLISRVILYGLAWERRPSQRGGGNPAARWERAGEVTESNNLSSLLLLLLAAWIALALSDQTVSSQRAATDRTVTHQSNMTCVQMFVVVNVIARVN